MENQNNFEIFYEDKLVLGILAPNPVNDSHIIILPKQEAKSIDELNDEVFLQMNYVATYCSTVIFQGVNMHGTNIIIYDGNNSDNQYTCPNIHVIGRLNEDNLNLKWEPKKADNLKEVATKIKDNLMIKSEQTKPKEESKNKEIKEEKGKVNYMIRQIFHMP